MRVLIADDVPSNFDAVQCALQPLYPQAELIFAHAWGEDGVNDLKEQIVNNPPDVLISDQHFSDYGHVDKGTDVIRWIREDLKLQFPIILFTSDDSAARLLKKEWGVRMACYVSGVKDAMKAFLG